MCAVCMPVIKGEGDRYELADNDLAVAQCGSFA